MRALVFERFGEPADVLQLRDVPTPEPGPGEVRVRMIASPVNPSDIMVLRGRYGALPTLPATPGFEGVGIVDKAGPGLLGRLVLGKRVTVINRQGGNWADYAVVPARQARPVPQDIPDEQVASFFVNPATVLAMVRHVLRVPNGDWLLQSAANSNLGRMIIRLGKHDGFRTINIVRRRALVQELKALGADVVIATEDGPIAEQVRAATKSEGVRFALDPVGGAIGTGVFDSLAQGGRLLVYGSLTGEPIAVAPRPLISRDVTVSGFWLGRWMETRSVPQSLLLLRQIATLVRSGVLATDPGPAFPIDQAARAVVQAENAGASGKVLLRLDGPPPA